jgi:hypothetical protein
MKLIIRLLDILTSRVQTFKNMMMIACLMNVRLEGGVSYQKLTPILGLTICAFRLSYSNLVKQG